MAMRPRTPRTQEQPSIRPVYENFQPKSEMKEKDEAYFLHIYLPGFIKETIKINFVSSSRTVRVVGEKPTTGRNRISRFEQTYPVPENCEVEKLQGKFEHGTLIITMPKKSLSQVTPKAQVETTKTNGPTPISPSNKAVSEQKLKEAPREPIPTTPTRMEQEEKQVEPIRDKKRHQNIEEETMPKSTTYDSTPKQQPAGNSQKGQEKIEPKPPSVMETSKQIEEMAMSYIETVKKKLEEKKLLEMAEKKNVPKKEWKPYEARKREKYIDHNEIKEGLKIKTKGSQKEAKGKETSTIEEAKSKEDEMHTIGKGIKEVVASASEVVTRIGEGKLNDEEKPLVANMGAAILVIVALGAYVTYKFTSADRN